jgi:hypothetical protein
MCEGCVGHELNSILETSPQAPLDFAIFCSGFAGTPKYYRGFYAPELTTPTVHVVADWDTMVPDTKSTELINCCRDPIVIRHKGTHHLPRDRNTVKKIADSIDFLRKRQMEPQIPTYPGEGAVMVALRHVQSMYELQHVERPLIATSLNLARPNDSDIDTDRLEDATSSVGDALTSTGSSQCQSVCRRHIVRRYRFTKAP